MVGCDTSRVTFPVGNNHAVCQRIQIVLLAQHGKQLHRCFIGAGRTGLCRCGIGAGEGRTTGVLDTGRFAHLHTDVGVVGSAARMPAAMVPGKGLINRTVQGINEAVNTGTSLRGTVPTVYEHRCLRLGTTDAVEHQALNRDLSSRSVTRVLCQNTLDQFHGITS